jgi:hypothetical protein
MGAHKLTALFLYTDLQKAAPLTLMSILKKKFQIAIFHTNTNTNKYLWDKARTSTTQQSPNLEISQSILLFVPVQPGIDSQISEKSKSYHNPIIV